MDDDPLIRSVVKEALEDEGCTVREARNGQEALDVLASFRPDVIVLDMRMPVMDGWGFATAYRAQPGDHAPIVVLTAAASAQTWAGEIGAQGVVPKPFDLPQLYAELSRFTRCVSG